ncbi:helix-turn-helix transcriptional regulator [Streptantibioticus parmotrematis]|uniref:helix-turn-helix domain-containing protein n=1 Tax=Streptantibioticus parmotrematis TaxID=2873249 RepID=UPI0034048631
MAARKPPTERQSRLGVELRRMREHAGLTINEAAVLHGTDRTTVSNTESARSGVSSDRVRVWAANYSCANAGYIDALARMARERGTHWWDEYRESLPARMMDLAELEHHASALRTITITHVPGLLQTADYMRAVFEEAVPPLSTASLERHIEFRLRRAEALDREAAPPCTFLVHETALRLWFGSRSTLRNQLAHLLAESERDAVSARVIPFDAGGFPDAGSSTLYAHGPVPALDTVQIDVPRSATFLHAETHLANYRVVVHRMEQRALDESASRDFIRKLVREI